MPPPALCRGWPLSSRPGLRWPHLLMEDPMRTPPPTTRTLSRKGYGRGYGTSNSKGYGMSNSKGYGGGYGMSNSKGGSKSKGYGMSNSHGYGSHDTFGNRGRHDDYRHGSGSGGSTRATTSTTPTAMEATTRPATGRIVARGRMAATATTRTPAEAGPELAAMATVVETMDRRRPPVQAGNLG